MFSSFTARLRAEVETVKRVIETDDRLRTLVFRQPTALSIEPVAEPPVSDSPTTESTAITGASDAAMPSFNLQALDEIRRGAPSRVSWQVHDHCAAFTRLYAVYEEFIRDLVSEYLRLVPVLYEKYAELPENMTTQHRLGIAQILLKLGKEGPYRDLDETKIIGDLAHGLGGGISYKLLPGAFLIDPQNYRHTVLVKLFGYLGIKDCWTWVERHPLVTEYVERERDSNETAATVLHDFVEYRNEAAHGNVTETVSIEEQKSIADCILVVCEALAQLVMMQVIPRREKLGQVTQVGDVIHKFSNCTVGVRTRAGTLAVGDELIVVQRYACYAVSVRSIQTKDTPHERLEVVDNQEIGLRLSLSAKEGARLVRLRDESLGTPPEPTREPPSEDEYPVDASEQTPPEAD